MIAKSAHMNGHLEGLRYFNFIQIIYLYHSIANKICAYERSPGRSTITVWVLCMRVWCVWSLYNVLDMCVWVVWEWVGGDWVYGDWVMDSGEIGEWVVGGRVTCECVGCVWVLSMRVWCVWSLYKYFGVSESGVRVQWLVICRCVVSRWVGGGYMVGGYETC